ncbi:MAG: single-stranded-DNA-specific exonuclease RecJ [Bacteroidales bacterium]|nr:single-stranded-DNA-specific exonuclease RecJ [Bacteroidales bacterium]
MKEKRWIIRNDYDLEVVSKLSDALGVDQIIATLLVERGVTSFDEAKRFFRPSLEQLHDPFLMKGMSIAVARIDEAIARKERILVYGDYDVDGTSAVAVVYSYFRQFHNNIDFYIPDRDAEGYGISFKGIDYARDTGVKLIIALDCGVKAVEQVAYAATFGIDFIIGDHHLPGETLPAATALLDPKQDGCAYPYKELSGCGIGFKIVEAYVEQKMKVRLCDPSARLDADGRKRQEELQLKLLKFLDLVALSIASDIVPMTGENRVLAAYGLKVINTWPRPGIEAILRYGHIEKRRDAGDEGKRNNYFDKDLSISDLVFLVGPRINAAGRIRTANDSVRLMISTNMAESRELASEINRFNTERKDLDYAATEEAKAKVEQSPDAVLRSSIVLFNPAWHKGVVGIVASRLVEEYYKPTIIFTEGPDDLLVGSARSIKGFDIHTALEECGDLLEHFGGHTSAAGVSLKAANLERFTERFDAVARQRMKDTEMKPEIEIDAVINFADHITPRFLRILKQFAPFGPENNVPVFCTRNLVDTGFPRLVGTKDVKHLKFSPIQIDVRSKAYPAIGFQLGQYYDRVCRGDHFDLCYQLDENTWRGKTEIQLNVRDIKFIDE